MVEFPKIEPKDYLPVGKHQKLHDEKIGIQKTGRIPGTVELGGNLQNPNSRDGLGVSENVVYP